jgi:hypothetical protein
MIQLVLKEIEDFVRLKDDLDFVQMVQPGHQHFADTSRTQYILYQKSYENRH